MDSGTFGCFSGCPVDRSVTVITPTLAERSQLLAELANDLCHQTVPFVWFPCRDDLGLGPGPIRNVLALMARTEWLAFIDDDDRVDANHLDALLTNAHFADVVYSLGRVEGRQWTIPHDCNLEQLDVVNQIPMTSLVRRSAFIRAGGFPEMERDEDWGLWRRMKAQGARFRCVHLETWTYRFHDVGRGNRTWWNG